MFNSKLISTMMSSRKNYKKEQLACTLCGMNTLALVRNLLKVMTDSILKFILPV